MEQKEMKRTLFVVTVAILILCVLATLVHSRCARPQCSYSRVPLYVYIHVCCIGEYKQILRRLVAAVKGSCMYDSIKEIRLCVLGSYDPSTVVDAKVVVHASDPDVSRYEQHTINVLRADAERETFYALYLHTKGVTKPGNERVKDWVEYMLYFATSPVCPALLESHDTVGVNLQETPVLHYSGNFWWARSSYLRTLAPCSYASYNSPEFWLTEGRTGRYASLWTSGVNHYNERYAPSQYKGMGFRSLNKR